MSPFDKRCLRLLIYGRKESFSSIGKITVLITIILSKFIHLFQSLPTPPNHIKQITKIAGRQEPQPAGTAKWPTTLRFGKSREQFLL